MPLGRFSDPVKVTVSLCCKTLWDERIPNWVETLVCNCLIPFCFIQEKERERCCGSDDHRVSSGIFTDEIEWHGVQYSGWFHWTRRLGSSSIVFLVFCNAADGIRVRGAFVVSDVPSPFCTEPAIVGANKTSLPSDRFHWTKDTVWKYVLYNPGMGKGSCQQYLCLFSIRATHQKTTLDKMQWSCQGPRCDSTFFPLIVAFCVLVIKNNNGLLSPTLAGSQAGTIRGRLIGRTGWGICWRRHGP